MCVFSPTSSHPHSSALIHTHARARARAHAHAHAHAHVNKAEAVELPTLDLMMNQHDQRLPLSWVSGWAGGRVGVCVCVVGGGAWAEWSGGRSETGGEARREGLKM